MNNLREIRRAKNLSREKLELASGVPARAIKAYESGQVNMMNASYGTIVKLCLALDVSDLDLIGEDLEVDVP